MVIDDEESLVRLVTETLAELGYTAAGFTTSAAALDAFLADPGQFDAIITDESMPGMSGSDLIRRMRAVSPAIPILLVSGYLSTAVVRRAEEAGAREVLRKPLSAHHLAAALDRVLHASPAAPAVIANTPSASPRPFAGPKRRATASPSRARPSRR